MDTLECQLVQIWEELLPVRPIGIRDDFFELGGHSLLAVRMFARLEKCLRIRLPLVTLFQTPTIEAARRSHSRGQSVGVVALTGYDPASREPTAHIRCAGRWG